MKMTTQVAYRNMKHYKSKNLLTGIAIALTTLLLFVVPTVGKGIIDYQLAFINLLYPSWHALYRNVDAQTVKELAVHHDIADYGLRSDAGILNLGEASADLIYLDAEGASLYRTELAEGTLPARENEIVVSPGILEALGQQGSLGSRITVPFQIYRDGGLDYTQQQEFVICGFLEDSDRSRKQKAYTALISDAFLKKQIPENQIAYRFLFQIDDAASPTTDEIETCIKNIAEQFGIPEADTNINTEYLWANYVDPATVPIIVAIMGIILLAGVITIYSIYYVSMNQRIREFGRLKAIGVTKRQLKQIVLREGLCVSAIAIPAGLILGTPLSKAVLLKFTAMANTEYIETLHGIIKNDAVNVYHWWIYLTAIAVSLLAVWLSLAKPMRIAANVSEIEAMRYHGAPKKRSGTRKGYGALTIGRLTRRNLTDNKKESLITIVSMAATGLLLMIVATILSCANPKEIADNNIVGQYELSLATESGNQEHPEREWSEVQKHNPLNAELKAQIERLDGVQRVDAFTSIRVTSDMFPEEEFNTINGVPEEYAGEIEKGIIRGNVSYEDLKSGDQVIVDTGLLYWYPDLNVGDRLNLTIHDGDRTYGKEIEIAAIGDYRFGLLDYNYLIMAKEAADRLCENNSTGYYHVIADKKYDPTLADALRELADASDTLTLRSWQDEYNTWKSNMAVTTGACWAFLGILAAISVMNLINTMIHSVHIRKKELGMMQAIGMSDRQLMKMLQLEGLFYTAGTLAISVGLGSLAGYPVFLYAKRMRMFGIRTYHYPIKAAIIVSAALLLIQAVLAIGTARSVRKDSLIERIRFSD